MAHWWPVSHVDDEESLDRLTDVYAHIHGDEYRFALRRFRGEHRIYPMPGRLVACFLIQAREAGLGLFPDDLVRGPRAETRCEPAEGDLHRITERTWEPLWPGDTVCVDGRAHSMANLTGEGVFLEVSAPMTAYVAPRLTLLRNLPDRPGGCAAHPGAFRREALPPVPSRPGDEDRRGVNRVNMHALDMRTDREPPPSPHHHGPVPIGAGKRVNHSETALILPRSRYGLPEHADRKPEHLVFYRNPLHDPTDRITVPVEPGSIVITPAAEDWVMGHAFQNVFALLVAVPGFVSAHRSLT